MNRGKFAVNVKIYEASRNRPMKVWVSELSKVASYVVTIGDCAVLGGIPAVPPNPSELFGLHSSCP